MNNHGEDYKGGILQFQDGDPSSIVPVAGVSKYTFTLIHVQNTFLMKDTYLLLGNYVKFYEKFFFQDVVIYTADNRNVHCVTEVHFCCLHYLNVSFLLFLVYTWMHIDSFMSYWQL